MEIGNLDREIQRDIDLVINARLTCQKKGCRPWLHKGNNLNAGFNHVVLEGKEFDGDE